MHLFSLESKTRSLPELAKVLEQSLGGFLTSVSLFRSYVMLHNSQYLASDCTIDVGLAATLSLEGVQPHKVIEYFYNPVLIGDAERFRIYFLL